MRRNRVSPFILPVLPLSPHSPINTSTGSPTSSHLMASASSQTASSLERCAPSSTNKRQTCQWGVEGTDRISWGLWIRWWFGRSLLDLLCGRCFFCLFISDLFFSFWYAYWYKFMSGFRLLRSCLRWATPFFFVEGCLTSCELDLSISYSRQRSSRWPFISFGVTVSLSTPSLWILNNVCAT